MYKRQEHIISVGRRYVHQYKLPPVLFAEQLVTKARKHLPLVEDILCGKHTSLYYDHARKAYKKSQKAVLSVDEFRNLDLREFTAGFYGAKRQMRVALEVLHSYKDLITKQKNSVLRWWGTNDFAQYVLAPELLSALCREEMALSSIEDAWDIMAVSYTHLDVYKRQDHIKVFSRTLFVGGVPPSMKEYDIAHVLRPYGEVQSVILNSSRKHAFVKVYSRQEAENVLNNFNKDGSSPLRTRWGVGFGPRDCCDYQHGYSVIPLHRLTDADKKWTTHAEWGGTGGQPLQQCMAFEEPDIVVGEGVSSKAISQKMPTDSGRNGPKSGKPVRSPPFRQSPGQNQFYGQMATGPVPAPVPASNPYPPANYGALPPILSLIHI